MTPGSPVDALGRISAHTAACWPKRPHQKSARWRHELFGTIAQRLNLKHELHHTVPKLCILGFEPLKRFLIAAFGDMSIRTALWLPSVLTGHLQTQHIFYPV